MKRNPFYQYTESGLDNVFLDGGYDFVDTPGGKTVIIRDIDGLQRAIGFALVGKRQRLTGREFRFLRSELLLSQATLAKVLGVKELTVGRWERNESEIPVSAEAIVRMMFEQSFGGKGPPIRDILERVADLEDEIDRKLTLRETKGKWNVLEPLAA